MRELITKYVYKSTTVYCMSPRRNWDFPNPLSPASVPLPPANWAHFFGQRDANEAEMKKKKNIILTVSPCSCRAKFLVPDWGIWNKVDSGVGLSYNPTSESTISPSQGLRIWLQITLTESERFGLVFAKTGSLNSGTGTSGT